MRISDWSSDVCSSDLRRCRKSVSRGCRGGAKPAAFVRCKRERNCWVRRLPLPFARAEGLGERFGTGCTVSALFLPLPRLERREERSEEHTSDLQSLMRISYAVFCLKKKKGQKS